MVPSSLNLNCCFVVEQVVFNVGQVVHVLSEGCNGVIGGWDLTLKAPDDWITDVYGTHPDKSILSSPHYLVFLDVRQLDTDQMEMTYVAQDDLEEIEFPKRVISLMAEEYFEGFSNGRHQMRPWLKQLYPNDS